MSETRQLPVLPEAADLEARRAALAARRAQELAPLQAPPISKTWGLVLAGIFALIVLLVLALLYVVAQSLRLAHENIVLSHKLADAVERLADAQAPDYTGGFLVLGGLALVVVLLWGRK